MNITLFINQWMVFVTVKHLDLNAKVSRNEKEVHFFFIGRTWSSLLFSCSPNPKYEVGSDEVDAVATVNVVTFFWPPAVFSENARDISASVSLPRASVSVSWSRESDRSPLLQREGDVYVSTPNIDGA